MISELIETHKLSVIHAALKDPEVEQVWHVVSPFVDGTTKRISSTNARLSDAVLDVVFQLTEGNA